MLGLFSNVIGDLREAKILAFLFLTQTGCTQALYDSRKYGDKHRHPRVCTVAYGKSYFINNDFSTMMMS